MIHWKLFVFLISFGRLCYYYILQLEILFFFIIRRVLEFMHLCNHQCGGVASFPHSLLASLSFFLSFFLFLSNIIFHFFDILRYHFPCPWSSSVYSSLIHFKNCSDYPTRETAKVFFLWSELCSWFFFLIFGDDFAFFFEFPFHLCLVSAFNNFPFLYILQFFPNLVVVFFMSLLFCPTSLSEQHSF